MFVRGMVVTHSFSASLREMFVFDVACVFGPNDYNTLKCI